MANLTFETTGLPGEVSELLIDTGWSNYDIGDPDANPIPLTPQNGMASIAPARVDAGSVSPESVLADDTVDIGVNIGWALNQVIGQYSFLLYFDPGVFEVTAVTGGGTTEFSGDPGATH